MNLKMNLELSQVSNDLLLRGIINILWTRNDRIQMFVFLSLSNHSERGKDNASFIVGLFYENWKDFRHDFKQSILKDQPQGIMYDI